MQLPVVICIASLLLIISSISWSINKWKKNIMKDLEEHASE